MRDAGERIRQLEDLIARFRRATMRHQADISTESAQELAKARTDLMNEGRRIAQERPHAGEE